MKHTELILTEVSTTPPHRQQQTIQQIVTTWLNQALQAEGRCAPCAVPSTSV